MNSQRAQDICLLIPGQAYEMMWIDPVWRRTRAPWIFRFEQARLELEARIGRALDLSDLRFAGRQIDKMEHRTLTSVVLASVLERAGFSWRIFDPGPTLLAEWRKILRRASNTPPRSIGISTTFVTSYRWLNALCHLVREFFPRVPLIIGGQFYMTSPREFLALDADIYCVEEGEECLPLLVEAITTGEPLDQIPGLYLRDSRGELYYSAKPTPFDLSRSPAPDWRLSGRITPPIDLQSQIVHRGAQTQRGCAFKCEFCTVRRFGNLSRVDPAHAAEMLLDAGIGGRGIIQLADSTASHPHERWVSVLECLIDRGGSRVPVLANVRATDIDDKCARLMRAAGVLDVMIGQESGDQSMLDAMRKGIRVSHLRPALQVLSRHGLTADVSFILGYPGETTKTMAATREMIMGLNDECEDHPVVLCALAIVFEAQGFATVTQRRGLHQLEGTFAYGGQVDANRAERERITLALAMSRKASAPVTSMVVRLLPELRYAMVTMPDQRYSIFRWLKALDRGIALFLESRLYHKKINAGEFEEVKRGLLSHYDPQPHRGSTRFRFKNSQRVRARSWLTAEWQKESDTVVGPLTRVLLSYHAYKITGSPRPAIQAALHGQFPDLGRTSESPAARARREELAMEMIGLPGNAPHRPLLTGQREDLAALREICTCLETLTVSAAEPWRAIRSDVASLFRELDKVIRRTSPEAAARHLEDPIIQRFIPTLHQLRSRFEYEEEKEQARRILASTSPRSAMLALLAEHYPSTTIHSREFQAVLDRSTRCIVVGSGPLPVTALLIQSCSTIDLTCLDREPVSCALGDRILQAMSHGSGCERGRPRTVQADVFDLLDFQPYDLIFVVSLVDGSGHGGHLGKRPLLVHLSQRMQPGSTLCLRTPFALGALIYSAVETGSLVGFELDHIAAPCTGRSSLILATKKSVSGHCHLAAHVH